MGNILHFTTGSPHRDEAASSRYMYIDVIAVILQIWTKYSFPTFYKSKVDCQPLTTMSKICQHSARICVSQYSCVVPILLLDPISVSHGGKEQDHTKGTLTNGSRLPYILCNMAFFMEGVRAGPLCRFGPPVFFFFFLSQPSSGSRP